MIKQVENFQDSQEDNTFEGIEFVLGIGSETLIGASAKIQFRLIPNGRVFETWSTDSEIPEIIITDANTITIPERLVTLESNVYLWDLKVTHQNGHKVTYVGGTWTIYDTITN